jgi:predicted Rossmann fold flavoprotein
MIIAIIGAGASGLMAAIRAAESGADKVLLFEKNALPGRKILLSGNGRCNVTNAQDLRTYPEKYFGNGKFLYKSLAALSPRDLIDFLSALGVKTKEEEGGRIFPVSERAQDIVNALFTKAEALGVVFHENEAIADIRKDASGHIAKVVSTRGSYDVDACVLCAGGSSYPATGSSGDGVLLAARLGHTIVPVRPGLSALDVESSVLESVQGVSLHDIGVRALLDGKVIASASGDLIFTHFGLSGPAVLPLSRFLPLDEMYFEAGRVIVSLDLWPTLSQEAARDAMKALVIDNQSRKLANVLHKTWPESLVALLMSRASIPEEVFCHELKKDLRERLTMVIKDFSFAVKKAPSLSKAMVTAGGVSLKEIDPKTLQSRLVPGLFFAGEVIDIDGDTGGYNLQAAFSTGYKAGTSACASSLKSSG